VFCRPVAEVILRGFATEIIEGQHRNGGMSAWWSYCALRVVTKMDNETRNQKKGDKACSCKRNAPRSRNLICRALREGLWPDAYPKNSHRVGDVLYELVAEIVAIESNLVLDLLIHVGRDADAAGI